MERIMTRTIASLFVAGVVSSVLFVASAASAREFQCRGQRIETSSGSTWGAAQESGSDIRLEKSGSTIGYVKRSGSDWRIEASNGSTIGYLKSGRIERSNGSTWTDIGTAKSFAECRGPVAAGLWVLKRTGRL
jgi:hypothetical protein